MLIHELVACQSRRRLPFIIQAHFEVLTDPRARKVVYPLINVVVSAICAVTSGAVGFVAIAIFGRKKKAWFEKFLDLTTGIPSHDRFNAIVSFIRPAEFQKCLLNWITDLREVTAGQIIAIDGKTLKRSFDEANSKSAIYMISAWTTGKKMSLGQAAVDSKSKEITAIPKLLKILEIAGSLVTIDVMGCQPDIAQKIVYKEEDYCLAVKGIQPKLFQGIEELFKKHLEDNLKQVKVRLYEKLDEEHGREDNRWYALCLVPRDLPNMERWPNLKAIGIAIHNSIRDGKDCNEFSYDILGKYLTGKKFGDAVRQHWAIENRLNWQLDVRFNEDHCRIRKGHADTNFSILHMTALSMLKNDENSRGRSEE